MTTSTLAIDAYQLTTLLAHFDGGLVDDRVAMALFFRRLPRHRNFVLFAGLRQLLAHAAAMRFEARDLAALRAHPLLGPALAARPALFARLEGLEGFDGEIDALPEGTPAFAGPGLRTGGEPFMVEGVPVSVYTPL